MKFLSSSLLPGAAVSYPRNFTDSNSVMLQLTCTSCFVLSGQEGVNELVWLYVLVDLATGATR